ncbi:MAG: TolC family protein [Pseudomonadota bacterium]
MPNKVLIASTATVVLVAGCVTPSNETVERQVDDAAAEQVPDTPSAWSMAAESGAVQTGWIKSFNDSDLTALVIEAQSNNRSLAAAAANVERAQALARQAGAALVPEVGVTGGGARGGVASTSQTNASNYSLGTQVSWELDLWGRVRSGNRAAAASAQAAQADLTAAQQSLAAGVAKAYFTTIEAQVQTRILKESVGILEETQRIVGVKKDNGLATAQDVALTNSDLASARERLVTIEGSTRDAKRALEALLGRYPAAELEVKSSLPSPPPPPPTGVPSELLERRPDLVSAERQVAAAFNSTNQARAAQLPSISLTGNVGGASGSLTNLLDPANVAWSAGANLLGPIFDGGRRAEAVNAANAEQQAALAAYGDAAINAFSEVETSLDQGVVLSERVKELEEAANEAAEALRIARLRYDEGEEELLNVLNIQQRVISAQSSLSSVNRLLLEQRINLNLALGGGWE